MPRLAPPPDLVRWSLIIGDCINNLRSALDHLIVLFTKLPAAYVPPPKKKRVTFIIIDDPDEFAKAMSGTSMGSLQSSLRCWNLFNRLSVCIRICRRCSLSSGICPMPTSIGFCK